MKDSCERPVDPEARRALATRIRAGLEGSFDEQPTPSTTDRGVRAIHERLFAARDYEVPPDRFWSAPLRRDAERALLFLETDLPGPAPAWYERIPGAFPIGWLFAGAFLAIGANSVDAPMWLVSIGLVVFGFAAITLLGGSLWILYLTLSGPKDLDPSQPRPDECWPFPDRAAYERECS